MKTKDETKCRAGILPALHESLGTMEGLSDDFDSGADGDNVVKLNHVGIA
jgi:hypothetical protein